MGAPELLFSRGANLQNALRVHQVIRIDHVIHHICDGLSTGLREGTAEQRCQFSSWPLATLQGRHHRLLGHQSPRLRGRVSRFHPGFTPQSANAQGQHQRIVIRAEEQTAAPGAIASASASHALQKRRHRCRCIDLNHMIEIANVNAQFQRRGGHNHAIFFFGKGRFCQLAL